MTEGRGHFTYRSEALGAFAHEVRTPLTAIKMVTELGRRAGSDGQLVLDAEIADMLRESIAGLEVLADGIQQLSWLERGKARVNESECDLATVLRQSQEILGESVALQSDGCEGSGTWDRERLPGCFADIAMAAHRCGSDTVVATTRREGPRTTVCFVCGNDGGAERPLNADLGFRFYAACVALEYTGATIECERRERYLRVAVALP